MKVPEALAEAARAWPDHIAIIDQYGSLTYRALWENVDVVRRRMLQLGVGPRQGVGVMARNGRSFVISAVAAVGCGATVMPIWSELTHSEVDATLADAPLCAIVHDGAGVRPIEGDAVELPIPGADPMRFTRTGLDPSIPLAPHVADAAFVRFTSGTTGESKGVALSHANVLERIVATNNGLRLGPGDVVLWVLPMAFHFYVSIVCYLRYGATVVVLPDHESGTILEAAERHGGTFLYASPLNYSLLAADDSGRRFRTLRRAISTSIGLPPHTAQAFLERYDLPVAQAYGIIEVGLPLANLDAARERPESVGRPLPDYEVAILDEDLRPVAPTEVGQLATRGPGMFAAYLSPPTPREEVLRDGWFLTGDLARQDAAGYVTIMGRSKSMINIAGHKVFPEEIQAALDAHPRVARSRVTGRPHPLTGEVIHADVVLQGKGAAVSPEELQTFCRERLSRLKTPHTIAFVEAIEETATGKIRVV